MNQISNIIFDIGNVIATFDPQLIASHFTKDRLEQHYIISHVFQSEEWLLLDRGTITLKEAITRLQKDASEEHQKLIKDVLCNWYQYFPVIEGMEQLIVKLKRHGYSIYAFSNAPNTIKKNLLPMHSIFALFDDIFISSDYHLLKPEPAIYEAFFQKFSLLPEQCFFIDDSQANIEMGRTFGMQGYVHTTKNATILEDELKKIGILS